MRRCLRTYLWTCIDLEFYRCVRIGFDVGLGGGLGEKLLIQENCSLWLAVAVVAVVVVAAAAVVVAAAAAGVVVVAAAAVVVVAPPFP